MDGQLFFTSKNMESKIKKRLDFKKSFDDLPDTLIVEIILKLPIKSVFRFKCISKRHLSLISEPEFAKSYTNHHKTANSPFSWAIFFWHYKRLDLIDNHTGWISPPGAPKDSIHNHLRWYCPEISSFSFHFLTDEPNEKEQQIPLRLIASDNGLFLFYDMDSRKRIVCNPLTMKKVVVPPLHRHRRSQVVTTGGFMVEDDGAFWVLQIPPSSSMRGKLEFQFFSSAAGQWRYGRVNCPGWFSSSYIRPTTLVYKGNFVLKVRITYLSYKILVFDPRKNGDESRIFDLPESGHVGKWGHVGVSGENLCFYSVPQPESPPESPPGMGLLKVWKMVDMEAGDWSLECGVMLVDLWNKTECIGKQVPWRNFQFRFVDFHRLDSDVIFLDCDGILICFRISTLSLEVAPCDSRQGKITCGDLVYNLVFPVWPTPVLQNDGDHIKPARKCRSVYRRRLGCHL